MGGMDMLEVLARNENNIFQSTDWAEFQEALGRRTWMVEGGGMRALVCRCPLFPGRKLPGLEAYFYSTRGPVAPPEADAGALAGLVAAVRRGAAGEGSLFYRVEPYTLGREELGAAGFAGVSEHSPLSRQHSPPDTLLLDIGGDEDEILAGMKSKCRYNIRLAARKGVTVRKAEDAGEVDVFYRLNLELEQRGRYRGHGRDYYRRLFETLAPRGLLDLFIAEHEGQPLAAIMVSYFGEVATYLHGASSNEKRELMPNNALQWEAIREARRRGCTVYDFWGVSPPGVEDHPWAGISRFKRGFGGEEAAFAGAFDLPFRKLTYHLLCGANRLRKRRRR